LLSAQGFWAARLPVSAGQTAQDAQRRGQARYRIETFIGYTTDPESARTQPPPLLSRAIHGDREFADADPGGVVMALAIAAATPTMPISPAPLAHIGL
jgi:hypothetical protein